MMCIRVGLVLAQSARSRARRPAGPKPIAIQLELPKTPPSADGRPSAVGLGFAAAPRSPPNAAHALRSPTAPTTKARSQTAAAAAAAARGKGSAIPGTAACLRRYPTRRA